MGCNQPGIEPCKDAKRIALLTDFAAVMKDKLDAKDAKYGDGPYTFEALVNHLQSELIELFNAMSGETYREGKFMHIASECIDVANMAFLLREKCFEIIKENEQ